MKTNRRIVFSALTILALLNNACGSIMGFSEGKKRPKSDNSDIPADPGGNAPKTVTNNLLPSFLAKSTEGNTSRIVLTLMGMLDEKADNKAVEFKANETLFVEEDGILKGIKVTQIDDTKNIPIDLVFLVDNSGSMGEEADHVADKIVEFADVLSKSGLDVTFGVVGYESLVGGGVDIGSAKDIQDYLNRSTPGCDEKIYGDVCKVKGTNRTAQFVGPREKELQQEARLISAIDGNGEENAVRAIYFANNLYSFRPGSQRVYLNFTDEAIGTSYQAATSNWKGLSDFSVNAFCKDSNPEKGVVFSVWSGTTKQTTQPDGSVKTEANLSETANSENPEKLSDCTGGTKVTIKSDASDLDLNTFDITKALRATAKVEFLTSNALEAHDLKVVVKSDLSKSDGAQSQKAVKY